VLLTVLDIDIDQTAEGWIAESDALVTEVAVKAGIVVVDDLTDKGELWLARLEDDQTSTATTACPSADLRHHHKSVLVGPEVGLVDHGVGIKNANDGHFVEVETLGDHLCADKQIGAPGTEVANDTLIGMTRSGGVEVHAADAGFGEDVADGGLNLLSTVAASLQRRAAATGTDGRHTVGLTTVVAAELVELTVVGQRHVATLTAGHPPALPTLEHGSIAATVLEEDGLLATFQRLAYAR
jgi:hypothetical protein